jgi:hypothetical protein
MKKIKTLLIIAALLLANIKWFGADCMEVEDFTDGGMSNTVQNYDGLPY